MQKLYAYGDSWTWGAELKDRNKSWPHELGKILGMEVVNRGIPGNSNKNISYSVVRDYYNNLLDNNLVVVMWTTPFRLGTPARKETTMNNNFLLSTIAYEEEFDTEIFNRHLVTTETLASIHTATDILKDNKYIFTSAFHDYTNTNNDLAVSEHLQEISKSWLFPQGIVKALPKKYERWASTGKHPDEDGHRLMAHLLGSNI